MTPRNLRDGAASLRTFARRMRDTHPALSEMSDALAILMDDAAGEMVETRDEVASLAVAEQLG